MKNLLKAFFILILSFRLFELYFQNTIKNQVSEPQRNFLFYGSLRLGVVSDDFLGFHFTAAASFKGNVIEGNWNGMYSTKIMSLTKESSELYSFSYGKNFKRSKLIFTPYIGISKENRYIHYAVSDTNSNGTMSIGADTYTKEKLYSKTGLIYKLEVSAILSRFFALGLYTFGNINNEKYMQGIVFFIRSGILS
jgi:hypothetical protein